MTISTHINVIRRWVYHRSQSIHINVTRHRVYRRSRSIHIVTRRWVYHRSRSIHINVTWRRVYHRSRSTWIFINSAYLILDKIIGSLNTFNYKNEWNVFSLTYMNCRKVVLRLLPYMLLSMAMKSLSLRSYETDTKIKTSGPFPKKNV